MALLYSISLYCILPRLYFTLLDSTFLYHDSTSLYLTLHFSTKLTLLHSTSFYCFLPWVYWTLSDYTFFYITVSWLYFTLFDSICSIHYSTTVLLHSIFFYHGSTSLYTWLYCFLPHCILPWLYFTVYLILYIPLPLWLYFTLLLRKHSIIITPFCSWECMVWTWD